MIMTTRERLTSTTALVVAGGLMILAGLSVVGLALSTPPGGSVSIAPETVVASLLGLVLAASGVEIIRRRHYWFAVIPPAALAILSAGYGIATGQTVVAATVLLYALVVALVAANRSSFTPRGGVQT